MLPPHKKSAPRVALTGGAARGMRPTHRRPRPGGRTEGGPMTARTVRLLPALACAAALLATGCVSRRFVIESNVPNAQVYIDNKPIGPAPAHTPFEYYGYYTVKLVHPGYETLEKRVHVTAPWYAYPPFDFLAEVVWPFQVRDTRRYYFELYEATQTRSDDILNAADALRLRGQNLPPAERPAPPRPPKNRPQPQPPLPPPADPQPGLIPSVQP